VYIAVNTVQCAKEHREVSGLVNILCVCVCVCVRWGGGVLDMKNSN
jgi:hypothetical protein